VVDALPVRGVSYRIEFNPGGLEGLFRSCLETLVMENLPLFRIEVGLLSRHAESRQEKSYQDQ
jgi:hypothetical protein